MSIDNFLNIQPFSLNKKDKKEIFKKRILSLTNFHYKNSIEYKKIIDDSENNGPNFKQIEDIPFLPVRLFKMYDLKSVDTKDVYKVLNSSGTTGQSVSKIYLDKETSLNQTKVLTKIFSTFIGNKRVPMIVIDSENVLKDRKLFSARGAGILGFSIFAKKRIFALDENMNIKTNEIRKFIEQHKNEKIFMFGFTFMIWKHFYKELLSKEIKFNLSNSVLVHGGGWKKLINEKISNEIFKLKLSKVIGNCKIYDYYGMVEQTGSIFMECEEGFLHSSIFSDIIVRRPENFKIADFGEKGILQVISILPKSYPGHSLLTEDEGIVYGEDDCKCGRKGKYFKIIGRLKNAEIRGCSDTYEGKI